MCFSGSSSSVNAEENLRKARKAADDEKKYGIYDNRRR